jgi:hypothetical protein
VQARFAVTLRFTPCLKGSVLNTATSIATNIVLVLNALWFGAAFRYFSLTPNTAAKILVPKSERDSPLLATVAASFALFAVLLLLSRSLFPEPMQLALFCIVFAVAHASQFAGNLPVAFSGKPELRVWPVLSGPMLFIFVVDFTLMIANAILAIILFVS